MFQWRKPDLQNFGYTFPLNRYCHFCKTLVKPRCSLFPQWYSSPNPQQCINQLLSITPICTGNWITFAHTDGPWCESILPVNEIFFSHSQIFIKLAPPHPNYLLWQDIRQGEKLCKQTILRASKDRH